MGVVRDKFGPEWLAARLAHLLPDFPNVSLCVALSGGVDSTALLAALSRGRRRRLRVRAVHVDHGLHPDAPRWSAHCRSLARNLGVPLEVLTAKVDRSRGVSLEAAAREARYALLATTLAEGEVLLTAHHEDDQLETVLLQLFRGAGLAGIAAMPAMARFAKGWLARPLLSRSRAELEAWARARGLEWVEDQTNADERLDRNYLRLRVLPLVRARWPGVGPSVARSARHAAEAQRLLDALARADVERSADGASLSVKALRVLAPERRRNALRFWISRSEHQLPDTRRLDEIAGPMLHARPDANPIVAWGATLVQRHADLLSIRAAPDTPSAKTRAAGTKTPASEFPAPETSAADASEARVSAGKGRQPGEISWSWRTSASCELPADFGKLELESDARGPVDLDALPDELTIHWRAGGERLRSRRGGPRRTLKSLLQEAHVPVVERARLPLIFAGERLLAVADLWLDESIQAAPSARHRGRLLWRH